MNPDDTVTFSVDEQRLAPAMVRGLMQSIRSAVGHDGFWIPPVPPIRQKTNSHYGATLPYGGPHLQIPVDNQISPGVHVCDSSCFTDSPAVSPTFTIMANASRIADLVQQNFTD